MKMNPRYRLCDGMILSVQASESHWCTPKNDIGPYTAAEVHIALVGTKGGPPSDWDEFEDAPTYYAYVPVTMIEDLIKDRGGLDLGKTL